MTQTLEEVALAFCKEVLGWGDDYAPYAESGAVNWFEWNKTNGALIKHHRFLYTDLDAVERAVREWMAKERLRIQLYLGYSSINEVQVWGKECLSTVESDNLQVALLSACVAAQRKIKGEV